MKKLLWATFVAACVAGNSALAAFNLQITEIWMGNEPGDNLTEDWFEVTNFGDTPWVAATDGNLWFDDDSASATDADLMSGIATIAPGESVVYTDEGVAGAALWTSVWGPDLTPLPQLGSYAGAGLSQGGDAVNLFLDADLSGGVTPAELLTSGSFPNAELDGGQSWDTVLGEFSTVGNASGAFATTATNDENQPAVGSPGQVIPEPTSALLAGAAIGAAAGMRRRRR